MRFSPRITGPALALLFAAAPSAGATGAEGRARNAQPQGAPSARAKQPPKGEGGARARALRERRQAVAVLLEVVGDARSLEDLYQRADVLALAADALWGADEQSARDAYARAWEAATASDEADLKDEREGGRYGDLSERFTRARDDVLASAARRDPRMSETFLRQLGEWLKGRAGDGRPQPADGPSRDIGPLNEFSPEAPRLALAFSLLDEDSYRSAAAVAAPAISGGVSGVLIEFLLRLRDYDAAEADRLYLRLLAHARSDARADTNDVLLLSSYVFTRRLLAVTDQRGSVQFRSIAGPAEAAPVARQTRAAFFDAAAAILLRPARQGPAEGDSLASYFALGRLLPFFQQEAPQHAPALHARLSALAAEMDAGRRAALDSQMRLNSLSVRNPVDPLADLLEEIDRTDPAARDALRARAVEVAVRHRLWERARRLADEIEGQGARDAARYLIAARQVAALPEAYAAAEEDDFEKAASAAREAALSPALAPAMRAYGLAHAALLASKRGRAERAAELLDEAAAQARQAQNGTELRAAASLMTATIAARLDSQRAWEAARAAVAALDEDDEFSGPAVEFGPDGVGYYPGEREAVRDALGPYDLEELFSALAAKDFGRAVGEARAVRKQGPRAYALVAAARAALGKGAVGVRAGAERK